MKKRYENRFDLERRNILKAIAGAGISRGLLQASPLVGGIMIARATEAATPSKSCLVFSGGGCHPEKWYPSGGTLPVMSAPLQPFYSKLNFLRNGTLSQAGHGVMFHRFNDGSFNDDSFDVNMGRTIGANYPVSVLNLGTTAEGNLSRKKEGSVATIISPALALQTLFAGGGGSGGSGGSTSTGLPARAAIVDLHMPAIKALQSKLGQHEKIKLESHLDSINELDKTINRNPSATPTPTPNPSTQACSKPSSSSASGFDATAKLQTEIMVLALSCNLTASVSLALGTDAHTHQLDKLGRESHQSHHNQGNEPKKYVDDIVYMATLTANILDQLNKKGLLDTTIFMQVSDMGDADQHTNVDVPMLLAGAGIAGGRSTVISGKNQADVFQTVGRLLGADQSKYGSTYRDWKKGGISL